jgi:hypothetical protein
VAGCAKSHRRSRIEQTRVAEEGKKGGAEEGEKRVCGGWRKSEALRDKGERT